MKKLLFFYLFIITCALSAGCKGEMAITFAPSSTPVSDPIFSITPTQPPVLPSADPLLPAFIDVLSLPRDEWPPKCRMRIEHSSGISIDVTGTLMHGDGLSLYLLSGLTEKAYNEFILEEGRVYPLRSTRLDTGEGLSIASTNFSVEEAMDAAIATALDETYYQLARDRIENTWNELYGFDVEAERGAVPYVGEYAILYNKDGFMRRILVLETGTGVKVVTMEVYESISEPPMFQYLCSMLASLRFYK